MQIHTDAWVYSTHGCHCSVLLCIDADLGPTYGYGLTAWG